MLVKIALLLVVCSFALAADPSPTTCPVGTYFCNGKCEKLKVKLGHTCAVDSDCREANSKCVGLTCQCAEKFESDMYNMSCNWIMYKLGQACPTDSCEVEHSHCNSTSYCSCSDGYAPDSNNTRCDKINRDLKQSCFFSDQCTTNAWCTGGKCACQPGYNASGLTCVLNKAELTESCKIDLNCNGPEAIRYCNSSLKCDCPAGYQVKKDVSGSLACQLNIRAVHESCSISAECTKTAGADQCDTTCECPIHEKYTTNICEQINLGTHCQRDRECVEFASCVYLFTPDGTAQEWICECWPGYIRTDDMKSCVVEDQLLCEPCVHVDCKSGGKGYVLVAPSDDVAAWDSHHALKASPDGRLLALRDVSRDVVDIVDFDEFRLSRVDVRASSAEFCRLADADVLLLLTHQYGANTPGSIRLYSTKDVQLWPLRYTEYLYVSFALCTATRDRLAALRRDGRIELILVEDLRVLREVSCDPRLHASSLDSYEMTLFFVDIETLLIVIKRDGLLHTMLFSSDQKKTIHESGLESIRLFDQTNVAIYDGKKGDLTVIHTAGDECHKNTVNIAFPERTELSWSDPYLSTSTDGVLRVWQLQRFAPRERRTSVI